ncbi:MAG: GEVED domain-containing protein, partial [Chloroflexota bacterium]
MRKIASVVAIAAGLVALLMFAVVTAAPDEPFASTVTIEPSYSGSDTAVKVGDIFTQRVRFERTDSTGLLQFEIQIAKSIMFETFTRPTISKSGNVSTNKVFQTDEAFHYRGTVDGNGIVEIGMAARVGDCGKPPEQCPNTISVNILNSSGEVVLSEDDEVQLVAGDFDRSQVSIEPTYLSGPSQTEAECLIDCEPTLVVLKNDNPVPARIVVRGETPNGMKWSGSSNSLTSNMDIPAGRSADSSDSVRVFDVSIQANETISLPLYVALTDNRADDASFTLELKACVEAAGNLQCPFDDGLVDLDDLIYRSRRRDLGDAPDSSNHFAVAIDAYTGVLGNFPTTADTSLAAPHGPAHARPWPLHLGSRVSFEAAADVGPDQDGVNNIEPGAVTPLANLDRGDDGIRLDRVSFNSCEVATIPVQVAIAPVVAANLEGPAYINVWLDGNRDGDWDDGANCDTTAYEHIVIDHEVDVATLGAGLHTISVTTSLIPKEINDSTAGSWMRVMLSDEKSTKLTGQSYGDGRGKGSPYTFGETEDYLYYAADSDGYQPEIELTIEQVDRGDERREAVDGRAPDALSPSYRELIIRYRNNGFESAENLEIDVTLGDPTDSIAYALQSWCLTCVRSIKDGNPLQSVERSIEAGDSPDFRFRTFQIGTLEPGGFGRIILGWHGCLTCTRAVDASVAHSIVAKAGAKQWQVQALRADDKFNSPFVRLGWTGCLTCVRTIEDADTASVINWDSTLLHVKAQPGQTIKVLKNGVETGQSGTADSDGIWSSTISVDPNEREVYQAVAVQAGLESEPSNGLDVSCPSSGVQILAIAQTDEEGKVKFVPPLRATEGITVPD